MASLAADVAQAAGDVSDAVSLSAPTFEGGCGTFEVASPVPAGRHELQLSSDLKHWHVAPAVAETTSGGGLRLTMSGLVEGSVFFRLASFGSDAPVPPVYVNLQVDAELEDVQGLRTLATELERRKISATIFVSADYANRNALLVSELFDRGFEIALHGFYTGEQLASMTYEEQRSLLSRAKLALEGCRPCGTYKPILGFRPQYFSQNEDTYRVLDELELTYNSGFKVGQLFLPAHSWDAAPYPAAGHKFAVVPITTVPAGCDRVYLCDIACAQALKYTVDQWRMALMAGLGQSLQTRQPLVVLLHGYYSGDQAKYGYYQPVVDFLDAAEGKVTFVQSRQLLEVLKP